MYCTNCGNALGEKDRFCASCGTETGVTEPEKEPEILSQTESKTEMALPEEKPEEIPEEKPEEIPEEKCEELPEEKPAPPAKKRGRGILKWLALGLWLLAVAGGWVAALRYLGQQPQQPEIEPAAYRRWEPVSLTESQWYQYDLASQRLYCWSFREDGTALYGYADSPERSQTTYTSQEGSITVAGSMVWEYDALENCYWYTQSVGNETHRVRIFPAFSTPDLQGSCYDYLTEES